LLSLPPQEFWFLRYQQREWPTGFLVQFWPSASGVLYSDETVTGFRVRSNASEHLRAVIPAGYELKMGG